MADQYHQEMAKLSDEFDKVCEMIKNTNNTKISPKSEKTEKLVEKIKPIFEEYRKIEKKKRIYQKITLWVSGTFVVCNIFYLLFWDTLHPHLTAVTRIAMIYILPYFDWRYLKNEQCLIPKIKIFESQNQHFYQDDVRFNCYVCENLENVKVMENFDEDILIKKYVNNHIPIVFKKGLDHWKYDNPEDFLEKISSKNDFWYSHPCKLSTNIHSDGFITVGKLFQKAEVFESFFMHFQNCEKPAKVVFRNFTYRPDYLPEVYSPTVYNWLIWTKNYTSAFRKVELTEKITVFGQIFGKSYVRLLPRENCEFQCPVLQFELEVGEYVIFTPLWDLEYREFETGENLAAILEVRGD